MKTIMQLAMEKVTMMNLTTTTTRRRRRGDDDDDSDDLNETEDEEAF